MVNGRRRQIPIFQISKLTCFVKCRFEQLLSWFFLGDGYYIYPMKNLATALTICLLFISPSIFAQNAEENIKKEIETVDSVGVIESVMNLYKLKEDITGMIDKLESTRKKGKQILARIEHKRDSLKLVSKKLWDEINELEKTGEDKNFESAKIIREKAKRVEALVFMNDKDITYLKNAEANALEDLAIAKKRIADIDARIKVMKDE